MADIDILKQIPEKSKEFFSKMSEDWKLLTPVEKTGIAVLTVLFFPIPVQVPVIDWLVKKRKEAME